MNKFLWFVIILGMNCSSLLCLIIKIVFLEQASAMKTVSLEVIQPSTGPVCPGQEVILTCTVARQSVGQVILIWRQDEAISPVYYDSFAPSQSGPHRLGDFNTTAAFINNSVVISNATLKSAALSNSNIAILCESPPQANVQTAVIIVAGNKLTFLHSLQDHM